ncbi:hypothetical protein V5F77_05365 [Xanthobacter sp. DSM 24535]|uniref:hypothetical protein n=1 Tax=Roseixanthobacter psychrophilus TaxID=3119917 RepID=UPI003727F399
MKYRKGDVVSLTATVKMDCRDGDAYVFLSGDGYYADFSIPPEATSAVRYKIEVGDIVIDGVMEGAVVAISGDLAWTRTTTGRDIVLPIAGLMRAPAKTHALPLLEAAE